MSVNPASNPTLAPSLLAEKLQGEWQRQQVLAGVAVDDQDRLTETTGLVEAFLLPGAVISGNTRLEALFPKNLSQKIGDFRQLAAQTGEAQEGLVAGGNHTVRVAVHPPDEDGNWAFFLEKLPVLEREKSLSESAFEQALLPILLLTPVYYKNNPNQPSDFCCVGANPAAEALFSASISGKSFSFLEPFFGNQLPLKQLCFSYKTGITEKTELSLRTPDGTPHWYEATLTKMADCLSLSFTDITTSRTAQERLRKNYNQLVETRKELRELTATLEETIRQRTEEVTASEERFRLVASATTDAIYDWELSTDRHWWSKGLYTQFGYEVETSPNGRKFWELHLHPDDRDAVVRALHQTIEGGESWRAEYRFRKADGEYAWVLDRANIVYDETGVPYRMLGSMLDVSAIRAANRAAERREAEYFQLAESLPHIVWIADAAGKVIYLSHQWETLTGTHPDLPAPLAHFRKIIHPEDALPFARSWLRAVASEAPFEAECRLQTATGAYRWMMIRAHKMQDEADEEGRWNGVCIDVHERKTLNALLEEKVAERTVELKAANRELEHSNSELQQFAFVTSHDLKEPLRKIQIFGKMVLDKALKENNPLYTGPLGRIVQSSERLTGLINDLLDFSQLSGKATFSATDLSQIVQSTVADLGVLIEEKAAEIEVGKLPVIRAVPGQMQQLFQNLIANALKFSKAGVAPHIRIEAERVSRKAFDAPPAQRGAYVRIRVADNGIGFNEEYLHKIFTLFQRLHTRDAYEGTGLGLAIVQKIVNLHNGLITAQSREGEGATFIVVLPVA